MEVPPDKGVWFPGAWEEGAVLGFFSTRSGTGLLESAERGFLLTGAVWREGEQLAHRVILSHAALAN